MSGLGRRSFLALSAATSAVLTTGFSLPVSAKSFPFTSYEAGQHYFAMLFKRTEKWLLVRYFAKPMPVWQEKTFVEKVGIPTWLRYTAAAVVDVTDGIVLKDFCGAVEKARLLNPTKDLRNLPVVDTKVLLAALGGPIAQWHWQESKGGLTIQEKQDIIEQAELVQNYLGLPKKNFYSML